MTDREIGLDDLRLGLPRRQSLQDLFYRDARVGNDRLAHHDLGITGDSLKYHTGSFVVNLVDYANEVTVPIYEPVQIWNGGTGFMLIKREVLEKLQTVVKSYVNDVLDLSGTMGRERIYEFFPVFIEEGTERLLSEDYGFCKIARDNGISIWAAPWASLAHMGSYLFEGQLLQS